MTSSSDTVVSKPAPASLIGPSLRQGEPINIISPAFFNEVSQFAHTGVVGYIYLAIGHVAQRRGFFHWSWYGVLIGVGVALAAWKEGYYDVHHENAATRGSGLEDFAFYMVGILIAVLALWL
jgi:hypothetical protein